MSDGENKKALTPKAGCEECKQLRSRVDSANAGTRSLIYGPATGYQRGKSRSRQSIRVRKQMSANENAERLAWANLRLHEIEAHEGVTEFNGREYAEYLVIKMRGGRDKP